MSPQTSTVDREEIASEVSEAPELTISGSVNHQPYDVLLGRLAAASVVCTPFWLPIVNDWHSWSTGLVVTLGEVPLIGFTLLAAPKTFQSLAGQVLRRSRHAGPERASEHARVAEYADDHDQSPEHPTTFGLDPYIFGLVLFLVALAISAVAHPHLRGLQTLWRVLAMICLGESVIRRRVRATTIVHALIGITAFEAGMAIWQRLTHAPVGLGILGESPVPFYEFGNNGFAVNGTLPHPYPLAALALVSGAAAIVFGGRRLITFRIAALGAATSAIIIGLTISRSGLLSAAGIIFGTFLSVLLTWRRSAHRTGTVPGALIGISSHGRKPPAHIVKTETLLRLALVGIFVLGLAGSMVVSKGAWSNRAEIQQQGQSVNEISSARGDRMTEALGVFKLSPILGVGPGRYVIALAGQPELLNSSPKDALPAHNAGLLLLAEGGVPTALALLFTALLLGRRLLRLGADGIILTSAVFPFLMLDIVFVSLPSGLFLLGVWGALISALTVKAQHPHG